MLAASIFALSSEQPGAVTRHVSSASGRLELQSIAQTHAHCSEIRSDQTYIPRVGTDRDVVQIEVASRTPPTRAAIVDGRDATPSSVCLRLTTRVAIPQWEALGTAAGIWRCGNGGRCHGR